MQFLFSFVLCISQFQDWPSPRAKPPGNFFDGRIPHLPGKKSSNPPPPAYKNELKPHPRGIFLNYNKNMKEWERNHVKSA